MHLRRKSPLKHANDRDRRQDSHHFGGRQLRSRFTVPIRRPPVQLARPVQESVPSELDESTRREVLEAGLKGDLASASYCPIRVELFVDTGDRHRRGRSRSEIRRAPQSFELQVSLPAAFGTRAMARREAGGFIEEEELGVSVRAEHLSLSPFELEPASDPRLVTPRRHDLFLCIVKHAPVTEPRAAGGNGVQLSPRIDSILKCHMPQSCCRE